LYNEVTYSKTMIKMKNITVLVLLIVLFVANGFGQKCMIYGTTATELPYKYAYLYDQDTKVFVTALITNHQFSFEVDRPQKLKILMLSFNKELIKTYEEILESPDYKYPNGARMVALEDTVEVTLKEYTKQALVKGKSLNKDIDGMYLAIKSGKYDTFFKEHPDSPVAIVFLRTLAGLAVKGSSLITIQECKLSYDSLSDRLKNTDEGKELLKMIGK
jgi:hypothetical protein